MSVFTYNSGYRAGNEHDEIQRNLVRELEDYSKRNLRGVSWNGDPYPDLQFKDDSVVQSEKRLSGDLPSGKSWCRTDVALRIDTEEYAFEIKTSASDARNWPNQKQDYRSQGHIPVIVVTPKVVADLGAGHRLVTDSFHVYASNHEFYFKSDVFPKSLINHFADGSPISKPHDRCPECGYKLNYLQLTEEIHHRCDACGWTDV